MKGIKNRRPFKHTEKRKRLDELAENPDFIPSIYNYCDRWCERCAFTARCMNYAMSEAQFGDVERDLDNDAFWQKLTEMFEMTLEMVTEMAEEQGIDLDAIDVEETMAEHERANEEAESHDICQAAKAYPEMVNAWYDATNDLIRTRPEMLPSRDDEKSASMEDAFEVIFWYQHQIYVKLMRSLTGAAEEREEPEFWQEFPKDSDGSAKVALIGIDRSISAWDRLLKIFPDQETKILNILFHLERLRRNVEKEFPEARAFVRPGFDEI
jgi:hypothetical protein